MQRDTISSASHHCVAFQASCASIPSHGAFDQPSEDHGPAWMDHSAILIPIPIPVLTGTGLDLDPHLASHSHVPEPGPGRPSCACGPQAVHSPQPAHTHTHTLLWLHHNNDCHGDQALIPSEYSDDDVESLSWGWYLVPVPRAWSCWPAPCFPILSLCFFPPKPQVPGSEVEMWLASAGTSRARRPRELHLSWGPFTSVGTGGCARIDDTAFHFPMPPYPVLPSALPCPAFASASALRQRPSPAWLPWLHDFSWCLGLGRHLLIRIQYTPHPQTQHASCNRTRRTRHVPPSSDHWAVGKVGRYTPRYRITPRQCRALRCRARSVLCGTRMVRPARHVQYR